jgi:hypothetical protein
MSEKEFSSEANSYSRIPTEIYFNAKGQKNKDVISQKAFEGKEFQNLNVTTER